MYSNKMAFKLSVLGLLVLLGGCATTDYNRLELVVDNLDDKSRAIPGQNLGIDVVAYSSDGKPLRLSDGGLKPEDVLITASNATLAIAHSGKSSLKLNGQREQVPGGGYEIVARMKGKPEVSAVRRIVADFARVEGPASEDVKDLVVEIEGEFENSLVPGRPVRLYVTAIDQEGRRFVFGRDADLKLPLERLEIATDNMSFDAKNGILAPSGNRDVLATSGYALAVRYKGKAGFIINKALLPDFSRVDGPDPKDVTRLIVSGDLLDRDSVVPGHRLAVKIAALDAKGRLFRVGDSEFPLPHERLQIQIVNGSYDPHSGTIQVNSDYRTLLDKNFKVDIGYVGRGDIAYSKTFDPDFVSGLPLMSEHDIIFAGPNGEDGKPGRDGATGLAGRGGVSRDMPGENGKAGRNATNGKDGAEGRNGPIIEVEAMEVRAFDGRERLILMELRVAGETPRYFLRKFNGPALRVVSRGGKGGDGGLGGKGGDGGRGGDGIRAGDGGDGGQGGRGGDGGRGGNGGNITVRQSTPDLSKALVALSERGEPGQGGAGGAGGRGGEPGSTLSASEGNDRLVSISGRDGGQGQQGDDGRRGQAGTEGRVEMRVDNQVYDLVRRAPADITGVVIH